MNNPLCLSFLLYVLLLTRLFAADNPYQQRYGLDCGSSGAYLGPTDLEFLNPETLAVLERDGRRIDWVPIPASQTTNPITRLGSLTLPDKPHRMILATTNSGQRLFVSCGDENGQVVEVDAQKKAIVRRWTGIHSPSGLAYSSTQDTLYIGRRFHNDVLEVNRAETSEQDALKAARRFPVLREPDTILLTSDQTKLYVANFLPLAPSNGSNVASAISCISLDSSTTKSIQLPDGSNSIRGMALSPDGKYLFAVHTHANHRSITSQLAGGWTSRSGLSILETDKNRIVFTYLIDDYRIGAPNPWDVCISPDGKLLVFTVAGCREVDFIALDEFLPKYQRDTVGMGIGYSLAFGVGSVTQIAKRVQVPHLIGPRAVAMTNERTVVAGYFSDNLAIFNRLPQDLGTENRPLQETTETNRGGAENANKADSEANKSDSEVNKAGSEADKAGQASDNPSSGLLSTVQSASAAEKITSYVPQVVYLDKPPVLDSSRRGEVLFHDSELSLENWHSCATCHPDARVDGMNWDLLNDGTGNHKNTKNMLLAHQTPPNMITGVRADGEAAVRAGFIHIHFNHLTEPEYQDADNYLKNLRPIPGPRIQPDGTLTDSAKRGKRLFHSRKTGCADCHNGPYYTDLKMHDVGTENDFDMGDREFDTPTLIEIHRTGPYLHDGRYTTLEQLLFEGYHGDPEHRLESLTDQEKDDLIEFLLSL